jgi:hypothetical protein
MKKILKKITPLYSLYLNALKFKRKIRDRIIIPDYATKRRIILNIANKYNCNNILVETGTYLGDTVEALRNYFKNIISIELSSELALRAQKRFENYKSVLIVNGDSSKKLYEIISNIKVPIVFWLDGHYSSEFWSNDEYIITAKGEKVSPILEELFHIVDHPIKNHVILIDDARLFTGEDYPNINVIKKFVQDNMPNHILVIKKDIIRILPQNNS